MLETAIKLIGLGAKTYFLDSFNIVDFIVILVCIVELYFFNDIGVVSAFRAFRIFRFLQFAR